MSRLLNTDSQFLNTLEARNMYVPTDPYTINNLNLINSLNSIASTVAPMFTGSIDYSILERLTIDKTPLTVQGLKMLTNLFAINAGNAAKRAVLPTFNPSLSNIVDGGNIFTPAVNNKITSSSTATGLLAVLENGLTNALTALVPPQNPFGHNVSKLGDQNNNHNLAFYVNNTGSGQLSFLIGQTNLNLYKQQDSGYLSAVASKSLKISDQSVYVVQKKWFGTQFSRNFDFSNAYSAEIALKNSINSIPSTQSLRQEYGATQDFVNYLGETEYPDFISTVNNNQVLDNKTTGLPDIGNSGQQIVWGRTGVDQTTNNTLGSQRTLNTVDEQTVVPNNDIGNIFNAKTGLLATTAQLINASKGKFADQTRKFFKDRTGNIIAFNGSAVWQVPATALPEFQGLSGIRQHTILDPYNSNNRAIRFVGNTNYGGSENSVINNTVIPKFHPILNSKTGLPDNTNIMFSIENLATPLISDLINSVAYMDDNYHTILPLSEVGPNNCRMLWFPPYALAVTESTSVKLTETEFIGRGEPMYTYNNTTRSMTLSFSLLMDHPPQLKYFRNGNPQDFYKNAVEFFEFGTSLPLLSNPNITQLELKLKILQDQKNNIQPTKKQVDVTLPTFQPIHISFPNDYPLQSDVNTIFNEMYNNFNYEIIGINGDIYNYPPGAVIIDEINFTGKTNGIFYDQYIGVSYNSILDEAITMFLNQTYINDVVINIVGSSTTLYNGPNRDAYNEALAQRRIDATEQLIERRFRVLFPNDVFPSYNIIFNEVNNGDLLSNPQNGTKDNISSSGAKNERSTTVTFIKSKNINYTKTPINSTDTQNANDIQSQIDSLTKQIAGAKAVVNNNDSLYLVQKLEDKYRLGFENISDNIFVPGFHSQTPEDFHKRLTFLQQCTRQGQAIQNSNPNSMSSSNSVFGRQPVVVLRIGDIFFTRAFIENLNIKYDDSTWDMNPEGWGLQPMKADVSLTLKIIGGESLEGPINALQNAVSLMFYANSTYNNQGTYATPSTISALQYGNQNSTLANQKQIDENINQYSQLQQASKQ